MSWSYLSQDYYYDVISFLQNKEITNSRFIDCGEWSHIHVSRGKITKWDKQVFFNLLQLNICVWNLKNQYVPIFCHKIYLRYFWISEGKEDGGGGKEKGRVAACFEYLLMRTNIVRTFLHKPFESLHMY